MIINCYYEPFPNVKRIAGLCGLLDEEKQEYILAINSVCCDIRKRHAFGHEMAHLCLDHLNQIDRPIMECEAEANERAWEFYRRYRDQYNALVNGASSFEIKAE